MEITVYSKANCPACDRAKNKLRALDIPYVEVRVDQAPQVRDWLIAQGHRSVPQIYVDGKCFTEPVDSLVQYSLAQ